METQAEPIIVLYKNRQNPVGKADAVDLTREKKAADTAAGLSAHLTISQDQTSGSRFSREKLAALSRPLDGADVASVGSIPM